MTEYSKDNFDDRPSPEVYRYEYDRTLKKLRRLAGEVERTPVYTAADPLDRHISADSVSEEVTEMTQLAPTGWEFERLTDADADNNRRLLSCLLLDESGIALHGTYAQVELTTGAPVEIDGSMFRGDERKRVYQFLVDGRVQARDFVATEDYEWQDVGMDELRQLAADMDFTDPVPGDFDLT